VSDEPCVRFRAPSGDALALAPLRRLDAETGDDWDANWLATRVTAKAGAFEGAFEAVLRADELALFLDQLVALRAAVKGEAVLACSEPWVELRLVKREVPGALEARCVVRDDPAGFEGGELRFALDLGPADLDAAVVGLGEVTRAFPVIGDPGAGPGEGLGLSGDGGEAGGDEAPPGKKN
jgi:hypothetical protein